VQARRCPAARSGRAGRRDDLRGRWWSRPAH
jgi:hypothetical protein